MSLRRFFATSEPYALTLLHCAGARSPATLEDALAAAASAGPAAGALVNAPGTSASLADTLAGGSGLKPSQGLSAGHQLLAKDLGKAAQPRSLGKGEDSLAGAGSGEVLTQCRFKVGTPLQEVEHGWHLGQATSGEDSRGSGTGSGGDSGAAGHSRSSLVSDMSGLSGAGSATGLGAAALLARRGDPGGPSEGWRGAAWPAAAGRRPRSGWPDDRRGQPGVHQEKMSHSCGRSGIGLPGYVCCEGQGRVPLAAELDVEHDCVALAYIAL